MWLILVLYATERLGLGPLGFGLLTTVGALGGIPGMIVDGRLERSIGRTWIMRIGLLVETGTHLTLAITTQATVAMAVFFVLWIHEAVRGTTAFTIRQRLVPTDFQGRVASVYLVGVFGSLVTGAALGGVIAGVWGITGPFWFGFVGSTLILIAIWGQLNHIGAAE